MRILLLLLSICLLSCHEGELEVQKTSAALELVNGILYYQKKPFDGLLVSKYNDSTYKMKLQYRKGRKERFEKQWYENGQLAQERSYSKGIKTGKHLGWWANGTPKFEYHFNERGEYDGSLKEWYDSGQLVRDLNFSNGKEIGSQRMWSSTGKIRANYEVKNGERFGLIGLKKCYSVNIDSNVLQ